MTLGEREHIADLLQDATRSYRSISRETGYSDWTIRKIARELAGDATPMKQLQRRSEDAEDFGDVPSTGSWIGFGVFLGVLALAIWAGLRWTSPLDSTDFPHRFDS